MRALVLGLTLVGTACSLGNVARDDCTSSEPCVAGLGLGSVCKEGYCSEPAPCFTSAECVASFGYGSACSDGRCVESRRIEARCDLSEPPRLVDAFPGRVVNRLLIGAIFKTKTAKERARADAARLAVREINEVGGVAGTELGLVVCDQDGDPDRSDDAEARELTRYLAGELSVPVLLGPSSSSSSIGAVDVVVGERLPTAIVSPSATSIALIEKVDRFDPDRDSVGLFWRTCPSDALQGKVLAKLITDETAIDRVAVILQNDAYGRGLCDVLLTEIAARRSLPVSAHAFDVTDDRSELRDGIRAAVLAAADESPEAVVVVTSDASSTVVALEAAAESASLAGASFFLTDGSKDAAELFDSRDVKVNEVILPAVRGTGAAAPAGPLYSAFSESLMSRFDTDASRFGFVANTYDAAYVAAFALARARSSSRVFDGFGVAAGLANLSSGDPVEVGPAEFARGVSRLSGGKREIDVVGTSGALDFDPELGEAPGKIEIWAVDPATRSFPTLTVVDPTKL